MWVGQWRNQYGSTLRITDEADGKVTGIHLNDCLHFTGLLRGRRLETMWHVVSDSAVKPPTPGCAPEMMKLPWAHAVLTNADTFQRADD